MEFVSGCLKYKCLSLDAKNELLVGSQVSDGNAVRRRNPSMPLDFCLRSARDSQHRRILTSRSFLVSRRLAISDLERAKVGCGPAAWTNSMSGTQPTQHHEVSNIDCTLSPLSNSIVWERRAKEDPPRAATVESTEVSLLWDESDIHQQYALKMTTQIVKSPSSHHLALEWNRDMSLTK